MTSHRLLLRNIKELLTVSAKQGYLSMKECADINPILGHSLAVDSKGIICKISEASEMEAWIHMNNIQFDEIIDCSNFVVLPGLVDAHTHTLFVGDRSKQYGMKIEGKTYTDIYQQGLGIRYSTEKMNQAEPKELCAHLNYYLPKIVSLGTTTIQIKSGYGLNAAAQVKMLIAIEKAKEQHRDSVTIVSTFCGAHAIPKGISEKEQTADVLHKQIPAVYEAMQAKLISPRLIDVFCERNFFERDSTREILLAGSKIGLIPSFHGDELSNLQCGQIAGQVGARAISHLEFISDNTIRIMAEHKIAGVMLPTTQHIEKLPIPPIDKMRQQGMILCLGSDFCPNAFCYNMFMVAHLSCTNYRFTIREALAGCTINSAYALNISQEVGSLEEGKLGDIVLLEVPSWTYFAYSFGDAPIKGVIKFGKVIRLN